MSKVRVLAGDLEEGVWSSSFGGMHKLTKAHAFAGETIRFNEFASAQEVDEVSVKRIAGAAGWGLVGAALLGPLGAIGGVLFGGNKKEICFACELRDGRKFLATTDGKTWTKVLAATF